MSDSEKLAELLKARGIDLEELEEFKERKRQRALIEVLRAIASEGFELPQAGMSSDEQHVTGVLKRIEKLTELGEKLKGL